jgi:uncharacterized protein (DUF488 family)
MTHGVVSAGYEGRTIDSFVESLLAAGVTTVADVRLNPISRKAGFSKNRLSDALASVGIDYLHMRPLGNPRENREPFWSGRVAEGRETFLALLDGDEPASAMNELGDLAERQVVAVMCFEHDEDRCHRKVVIDILKRDNHVPARPLL